MVWILSEMCILHAFRQVLLARLYLADYTSYNGHYNQVMGRVSRALGLTDMYD
jgi:hypothetical protein